MFSAPGGDTVQVLKTMQYLRALGCQVEVSTELEPDLSGYDLVHVFNVTRPQESYLQVRNAQKQGKKLVLSTIFVSYSDFDRQARGGLLGMLSRWLHPSQIEYLKVMGRAIHNAEIHRGTRTLMRYGHRRLVQETIKAADVLLPNSFSELNRLCAAYPVAKSRPSIVVPNGIDPQLFGDPEIPVPAELERYRDCVLVVARLEGLKGQLQVLRAMRDLPWKLVLIGAHTRNHSGYFNRLRQEASSNVHILGRVEHDALPPYYRMARVHALVSWIETTGLSSLEAAAMGKNIVITGRGDTREYFEDLGYYCEPDSVASVRDAIVRAYESKPNPALRQRVMDRFTWRHAAEKTLEAYAMALGRQGELERERSEVQI